MESLSTQELEPSDSYVQHIIAIAKDIAPRMLAVKKLETHYRVVHRICINNTQHCIWIEIPKNNNSLPVHICVKTEINRVDNKLYTQTEDYMLRTHQNESTEQLAAHSSYIEVSDITSRALLERHMQPSNENKLSLEQLSNLELTLVQLGMHTIVSRLRVILSE